MALDTRVDSSTTAQVTLAQAPAQPSRSPASPARAPAGDPEVDQATETVREKLDQSGWFNDVTNDELKDITGTIDGLTPTQRNELLSNLSDDELKTLAEESGAWGVFGAQGLSMDERRGMLEDLAEGADGTQLERLSNAFSGEDDTRLLGDAIASHATPQAQLAFVQRMAGKVESDERAALLVAKAIGGMEGSGSHVDQALEALSGGKLQAVVNAAQQENFSTHANSSGMMTGVHTYDVEPLQALLHAAATGSNNEQKARLFDSAASVLSDISKVGFTPGVGVMKNDAEAKITEGLSRLLTSDTNGMMRELESQFRQGAGITTFTKQMINQGRTEELKLIVTQLQRGNDLQGDGLARFSTPDAQGQYRDAQTLGYFTGSIYAATTSLTKDIDKQVSTFKAIFGGTLSGGKDVIGNMWLSAPASKALLGAAVGATASVGLLAADEIGRQMKKGLIDQRDALSQFAYPREANGRLYEGERAETAYDTAVGRVIDANS